MRTLLLSTLALTATFLASDASAQGRRATPTPTATPGSPWIDPTAASTTPSAAAAATPAPAPAGGGFFAAPAGDPATYRPFEKSIAIGAGYTFGAAAGGELLWNPNTVSARYRFLSGLTIEPIAGIEIASTSTKVDSAKTTTSSTDIFLGTNVRKPLWSRAQADAIVIVGAAVESTSDTTKTSPGGGKTTSSGFSIGANWGIGVEFFPRRHWSISFDATNPLLTLSNSSSKDPAGVKTTTSSTVISPQFDPSIRMMTHLYY